MISHGYKLSSKCIIPFCREDLQVCDSLRRNLAKEITSINLNSISSTTKKPWASFTFKYVFEGCIFEDLIVGQQLFDILKECVEYSPLSKDAVKYDDVFVKESLLQNLIETYLSRYVEDEYMKSKMFSKVLKLGVTINPIGFNKRSVSYVKLRESLQILMNVITTEKLSLHTAKKAKRDDTISADDVEDENDDDDDDDESKSSYSNSSSSRAVYDIEKSDSVAAAVVNAAMFLHGPQPAALFQQFVNQPAWPPSPVFQNQSLLSPLPSSSQLLSFSYSDEPLPNIGLHTNSLGTEQLTNTAVSRSNWLSEPSTKRPSSEPLDVGRASLALPTTTLKATTRMSPSLPSLLSSSSPSSASLQKPPEHLVNLSPTNKNKTRNVNLPFNPNISETILAANASVNACTGDVTVVKVANQKQQSVNTLDELEEYIFYQQQLKKDQI